MSLVTTHDVELGADALSLNRGQLLRESKIVLDATSRGIVVRALRQAAHDLGGSDPSVQTFRTWLLDRANDIERGLL